MKNCDTTSGDSQTPEEFKPRSPDIQTNAKTNRAKKSQGKSKKNKKLSLWQHWKRANHKTRMRWIGAGLATVTGLGVFGIYVWDHFQRERQFEAEHKPLIVQTHTDFLQTFKCTPSVSGPQLAGHFVQGTLHYGNIDKTYKNIGTATAGDVNGMVDWVSVLPAKPIGDPKIDKQIKGEMQRIIGFNGCKPFYRFHGGSLEVGTEETIHMREGMAGFSTQVRLGDFVTFEYETCTTYTAEGDGRVHATCDLYSLQTRDVPNLPKVDERLGTSILPCDNIEHTGTFVPILGSHCQE